MAKIKLPKVNGKGIMNAVVFVAGIITTVDQVVNGFGEAKKAVADFKSTKKES